MKSTWYRFSVLTIAMATVIALAAPAETFAQRGGGGGGRSGGGGGGGGGHGGGRGGGGGGGAHAGGGGRSGGPSGGGQRGGSPQGGNYGGGNRGGSSPNWSGGNGGRGNQAYNGGNRDGGRDNPAYGGNNRGDGRSYSRNNGRPGSSNLNQFYGNRYGGGIYSGSGYRGNYNSGFRGNYNGFNGYGQPGFGPNFGNYGYGYFPWYVGLATYGAGIGRGIGYGGYNNGYATQSAPVIIEQSVAPSTQSTESAQATAAQNDYIPQMNRTTTVLGAQPSGAAVLGVTMDPQYPEAAVVREVAPGSAAEKAGLRPGDMITVINKIEVRKPADVTGFVAAQQPGDQVEMEFIRPILRSEVKEAAPEQGLGITAPAVNESTAPPTAPAVAEPTEAIPPPVPQPSAN